MAENIIIPDGAPEAPGPAPVASNSAMQVDSQVEAPPSTPEEPDVFTRDYVEELRRENAKYRTRAREYDEAFDGYEDDDRGALLEYIRLQRLAAQGDTEAQQYLSEILGTEEGQPVEQAPEYMTRSEVEQMIAQQSRGFQEQQAIDGVVARATDLGYQYGTREYRALLDIAVNEVDPLEHPDRDILEVADEILKGHDQQVIDAYLAQLEGRNERMPSVATGQGTSPEIPPGPRTWDRARDALHERLSNIQ